MQTERESKASAFLMAPTSSTEHSSEVDIRHQPGVTGGAVVKRKRTKRPRHHPPAASSSSESTTTEEEDMAHCLILLAQGGGARSHAAVDSKPSTAPAPQPTVAVSTVQKQAVQPAHPPPAPPAVVKSERYTSRKYTAEGVKAGFYVYECKTCNKCFPTFQALGGHRASHTKPRLAATDDEIAINVVTTATTTKQKPPPPQVQFAVFPDVATALTLNNNVAGISSSSGNKQLRVHECSICGAEFASGQALGGHMRRHRPLNAPERAVTAIATADATKKEGTGGNINLKLDLNLPAPADEEAVSTLPPPVMLGLGQFNDGKKAGLMLTASPLVDCHY